MVKPRTTRFYLNATAWIICIDIVLSFFTLNLDISIPLVIVFSCVHVLMMALTLLFVYLYISTTRASSRGNVGLITKVSFPVLWTMGWKLFFLIIYVILRVTRKLVDDVIFKWSQFGLFIGFGLNMGAVGLYYKNLLFPELHANGPHLTI
ncbi:hypothetical protein PCE1_004802 [Barthelona sp. PCE]